MRLVYFNSILKNDQQCVQMQRWRFIYGIGGVRGRMLPYFIRSGTALSVSYAGLESRIDSDNPLNCNERLN